MRRHARGDRAGPSAHARHRGRGGRRRRAGRRVGLSLSARNTFSGAAIDRAAHLRTDAEAMARVRSDPGARGVAVLREGALVTGDAPAQGFDAWAIVGAGGALSAARVALGADVPPDAPFLGFEDGAPVFALDAMPGGELPAGTQAIDLRGAAAVLPPGDAGLLAYAATLLHWHRTHRFCGRCGERTAVREGGHLRVCPHEHAHHPRTDPVVIMLVTEGDRVLLGRQPAWPRNRYSALAGFVDPGESLEAAVAREVREEAGVDVGEVRYRSSQPWPFPCSLMLGFEAVYAGGDAEPQDAELEDVRWFTREEIRTAAAAEGDADAPLLLPPSLAIARQLLDGWL